MYEDFLHNNPDYDLDEALDYALSQFPSDFEAFWGLRSKNVPEHLDPDDWEEYKRLYRQAERLALAARWLIRPAKLPQSQLTEHKRIAQEAQAEEEAVKELIARFKAEFPGESWSKVHAYLDTPGTGDARAKHAFFRTCIQLHAAKFFLHTPAKLAERMIRLLDYLIKCKEEGTRLYLARIAECYIRNMRTEFAVMCRAVLERALSDAIRKEQVAAYLGKKPREVTLADWIQVASIDILDDKTEDAAKRLKSAGNDAVHVLPGSEPDPDELLPDLVAVVERLANCSRE